MMSSRSSPRSGLGAVAVAFAASVAREAYAEEPPVAGRDDTPANDARPEKDAPDQDGPRRPRPERSERADDEPLQDEVKLRDGRRIRGRIVQKEPGRWVVIATDDGRRKTIAWDRVEELEVAPTAREARPRDPFRGAWQARTGGGLTYELRVSVTGVLLPSKTFGLSGECATSSGFAPASMYGQLATDSGRGAGGGVGGRLGYAYLSRIEPDGASSWWSLRAGAGLDLQVLHSQVPIGIKAVNGELCSLVARTAHEVETRSSGLLMAHVPLTFGAQVGLGSFEDGIVWRGIVLGAAWSPSYLQIWPWIGDASSYFNPLGIELTLDLATMHATSKKRSPEAQFRVSLFLAPSLDVTQPTVGMLGFGPAWY